MITEQTIRAIKYPPELIPDAWFGTIAINAEFAPPVLDLKRFSPNLLHLTNIMLTASANVNLRARYDDVRLEQNTAGMLSLLANAWNLPAKSLLYFNFFGVGAFPNYFAHYGVWAYPPTIAHKLQWGIALTEKEKAINDELGIAATVQKGLLPLPISQIIEREYPVVGEETHAIAVNIAVGGVTHPIEVLYAKPGEILVLTRIAATTSTAAENVQLIVDRDNDANYLQFPTLPLNLLAGGEVACFIPATREIRLTTTSTVAPGPGYLFRYTFQRIKLTNILRVRFGLMSEAEAPADLWKKVQAGVV